MLGETVRSARIKKGLTQAKLARLAGVSRRHLAALEKGANVSVLVLKKVASVLDLTHIQLGGLDLRATETRKNGVGVAVLADAIREARTAVRRSRAVIARAQGLINGMAEARTQSADVGCTRRDHVGENAESRRRNQRRDSD